MPGPHSPAVLFAILILFWPAPSWSMPGFVSGQLLNNWCGKNDGLDREACYSYLRGASDAFHAIADAAAAQSASSPPPLWPNRCMPARVSIAALRDAYLEFAARHPEQLGRQAASLLAEVLAQAFPCPDAGKTSQ